MTDNFIYNGKHLLFDAIAKNNSLLVDADLGNQLLESIVERIDMTMILPPITVKFPHSICELKRVLEKLEAEGLSDSKTAQGIKKDLQLRKDESYGYSSFVMIAESHISIHTFPELGYFSFDCYSCKDFDHVAVVDTIRELIPTTTEVAQLCGRFPPLASDGTVEMEKYNASRRIISKITV